MAVVVNTREAQVEHTGTKWVIDANENLVVLDGTKATAIYARGDWTSAKVTK